MVLLSPDRPDCVEGRLSFVFYSSLKNLKEVYICPAQDQEGPVRGQVRDTNTAKREETEDHGISCLCHGSTNIISSYEFYNNYYLYNAH